LDSDRARRETLMTPEEKRQSDQYLDELADRIMMNGIRAQFPDADEEQVRDFCEAIRDHPSAGGQSVTIEEALRAVVEALEAVDTPYMVVGSFSTNFYGKRRPTKDADLVIELGP